MPMYYVSIDDAPQLAGQFVITESEDKLAVFCELEGFTAWRTVDVSLSNAIRRFSIFTNLDEAG